MARRIRRRYFRPAPVRSPVDDARGVIGFMANRMGWTLLSTVCLFGTTFAVASEGVVRVVALAVLTPVWLYTGLMMAVGQRTRVRGLSITLAVLAVSVWLGLAVF